MYLFNVQGNSKSFVILVNVKIQKTPELAIFAYFRSEAACADNFVRPTPSFLYDLKLGHFFPVFFIVY